MSPGVRRTVLVSALVGATLLVGFAAGRRSATRSRVVTLDEVNAELAQGFATTWPQVGGKTLVKVTPVNGHVIWSPADAGSHALVVFDREYRRAVSVDDTHVIATFGLRSGHQPSSFNIWDKQGDGSFSFVTYDTLGDRGAPDGMIADADRDGQAELRHRGAAPAAGSPTEARTELFVAGAWYVREKKGDSVGVIVDGQWREVRDQGDGYAFVH